MGKKVLRVAVFGLSGLIGGKVGKVVRGAILIAAGVVTDNPQLVLAGIAMVGSAFIKKPKVNAASRDRLYATIDPATPRKMVFGHTAFAADVRYEEWSDGDQEYFDRIICLASHKITSVEEVWLDDKKAWTAAGGAQGDYVGYLTIDIRLEGNSGNTITINSGSKWGSSRRMTGLAYLRMRCKVTGNSKKAESPFSSTIPSRITTIGKAIPLYDPRLDSTQGGSGTMRADDQSTWAYTYSGTEVGRNPALELLTWLLGWRINGKLAVGRGVPPKRIDFDSFITAANACEEAVTLAVGGTEQRYKGDGIFSEDDDPRGVIENFETTMNAKLRDSGGRFSLTVLHNDLATPVLALDDDDVLGAFRWEPVLPLQDSFNEVRGRFTNPSDQALYQLTDYPRLREEPVDGIERTHTFDLPLVQSASQAQRLAKQQLARSKYPGKFTCELGARGWALRQDDIVTLTFSTLGWSARLFRVAEHSINVDGTSPVVLVAENADIYLWDADERPAVQPVQLVPYNPLLAPLIQAIDEASVFRDIKFIRSYSRPATPTDPDPAGWSDGVPPGDPPVWAILALKSRDNQLIGTWSTPEVFTPLSVPRTYNAGDTYYRFNLVLFGGGTYIATQDGFSGHPPSGDANANAYWDVFSAPGAAGPPGDPPAGVTDDIDLTSSTGTVNLRTIADGLGYSGHSDASYIFRVPNAVTIRGLPGTAGIDSGVWPTDSYAISLEVIVENGGKVEGGGGAGGVAAGGGGNAGGDAIVCRLDMDVTINSGGVVKSGGGGGGAGFGALVTPPGGFSSPDDPYYGGGGAGGGQPNGPAGSGEAGSNGGTDGSDGTAGTTSAAGTGGAGYVSGGGGGTYGNAGTGGTGRGTPGSAGYAVRFNTFTVGVTNSGTMVGATG